MYSAAYVLVVVIANIVHNFSHKFEDFVTARNQVMSGISVISVGLNGQMWTASGALPLGYANQRSGIAFFYIFFFVFSSMNMLVLLVAKL